VCCYVILGLMISRLVEIGRIDLPNYVRMVSYEIELVYLWPFGERQHQE